jgi:hypothetical protein
MHDDGDAIVALIGREDHDAIIDALKDEIDSPVSDR